LFRYLHVGRGLQFEWAENFNMRVSVFDTYVERKDGTVMHFDILVPETEKDVDKVYGFGREYLAEKKQAGQPLAAKECNFCHIEEAEPKVVDAIKERGYYIVEMQNCN